MSGNKELWRMLMPSVCLGIQIDYRLKVIWVLDLQHRIPLLLDKINWKLKSSNKKY
jgi:hypothetical protein